MLRVVISACVLPYEFWALLDRLQRQKYKYDWITAKASPMNHVLCLNHHGNYGKSKFILLDMSLSNFR